MIESLLLGIEDRCKTKEMTTSLFSYWHKTCKELCNESNAKYVEFLNNHIENIKNLLLQDESSYVLMLNATIENKKETQGTSDYVKQNTK